MNERIFIEKPDLAKSEDNSLLQKYFENINEYSKYIYRANDENYLYWTKVKHLSRPEGFSAEEYWKLIKIIRKFSSRKIAIKAENDDYFNWYRMQTTDEKLHNIDMYLGGQLMAFQASADETSRDRFIARGILEESIASSQLEGASTSRKVAKQMIAEQREPRDESEQMIYNNYQTMQSLETEYASKKLSLEMLFELHAKLVEKTLDIDQTHRLRKDSDEIAVFYNDDIAHIPPSEKFLEDEMQRLIAFANDEAEEQFTHPVIKAIFLHFWIGYLHPFTDGNGRLARTLFYWYLLKKNYWVLMYLPISSVIKRAPSQYAYAYLHSEQDDLDITYFYDFNLQRIIMAIDGLQQYISRIDIENRQLDAILRDTIILNDRQKRLLHHVLADNGSDYSTITAHMVLNRISRPTATEDIKKLTAHDLLDPKRDGKTIRYYASKKLLSLAKNRTIM